MSSILLAMGILGACSTGDQSIKVFKEPPTVTIQSPTQDSEIDQGVPMVLRGLAQDKKFETALDTLTPQWTANGQPICDDNVTIDVGGNINCTHSFESSGEVELELLVTNPDGETSDAAVTVTVISNLPPEVEITSPTLGGYYYTDVPILFEAIASDNEDEPPFLSASWNSSLVGNLGLDGAPDNDGNITGSALLTQGEHLITLTVTDSGSRTTEKNVVINVSGDNSAPSCQIISPTAEQITQIGMPVEFSGQAQDPDGIPLDLLTATWSSDRDGEINSQNPDINGNFTFSSSDLSQGEHNITLLVTDEVGGSCTTNTNLTIGSPPAVQIDSPLSGDVLNELSQIDFYGTVNDDEDLIDDLTVTWESNIDGLFPIQSTDSSGQSTATAFELAVGSHTITLTATDSDGFVSTDSINLVINDLPTKPVIEILPASPSSSSNLQVSVVSASQDLEGDPITYSYAWQKNGLPTNQTAATLPYAETTRGDEWTVIVTPNDGYGDGDSEQTSATIGNSAPIISQVDISPTTPNEEDTLSCDITAASDEDGDTITYTFNWVVNGTNVGITDQNLTSDYFSRGDTVFCTALPNDGYDDGSAVTSSIITIENSLPVLSDVTVSPSPGYESSILTCTPGAASDADGDQVSFLYDWLVNGSSVNITNATLNGSSFSEGDTVVCRVTPEDTIGGQGAAIDSTTVNIINTAPVLDVAYLSPDPAYESDTLICAPGTSSDDDGDSVTYTYDWSRNGNLLGLNATTLDGTMFDKNDSIHCLITPNDGDEDGAQVSSATIVISNTAPVVTAVEINPTTPTEDSTLSCNVLSSSDDDNDSISYAYSWSVDGVTIAATGQTINGQDFNRGQNVTCTVIPNDGTEDGTALTSAAVTIENTAPVLVGVSLTPTTSYEASTLTCTPGAASDSDSDTVTFTYAWEVNGSVISVTAETLDGTYFDKGSNVACIITPNDGIDDGASVSSALLTISNTPPELDAAYLTPDPAYEDSTLNCAAGTSSDDDGDGVTYLYNWTKNGAQLGLNSATLSGNNFNRGDSMSCQITPTDGSDNGTEVSSSTIVISNTAPSVSSVTITPSSAYTTDTISASPSGWYDLDGDAEGYMYDWLVNGSSVSSDATLNPSNHQKGDIIRLILTPYDGQGMGASVTSADLTILNTPPEAPVVEIQPTNAEPEDNIECVIVTPSYDADGDSITYTITWANNGVADSTLDNVNPIGFSNTSNGDTWTCTVTPNDGDVNGTSSYDSQVVQDITAPDTPVLDSIDAYRNDGVATITGLTEPNATVTLYQDCTNGQNQYLTIANSSGGFSVTVILSQGDICDFYAYATDGYGNQSAQSNIVSTEYCSIGDDYEDSTGYGDLCADPIDEWATIPDNGSQSVTLNGNIINSSDQDWYVFYSSQTTLSSGINTYNFKVELTAGSSNYSFVVHRGSCASADLVLCRQEGSTQDTGYTSFDYYAFDDGDGSGHQTPSQTNYCSDGSLYDNCDDLSDTYYVQVFRTDNNYDCTPYTLEVSNGN